MERYKLTGSGEEAVDFDHLMNSASVIMSEEIPEKAEELMNEILDKYWYKLSRSQQQKLKDLMVQYKFADAE